MLHDPRHDREPSLAGFALFVASKPPQEHYEWRNCIDCAVGQYWASLGHTESWQRLDGDHVVHTMNALARGGSTFYLSASSDWTWGKLADRILAHQMAEAA